MKLQIFIEDEDLNGSFRNFYINEDKISGWFIADAEIVKGVPFVCVNIVLDGGLYSVKLTATLRDYLTKTFVNK